MYIHICASPEGLYMYKSTLLYIFNLAGNLGAMYEGAVRLKILVQAQQREAL